MAFPHGHPHYAPTTDGLYRPQTCPELNSPPTGHFLPSIRYLPTEYPLRNDPSFLPQGLSSAGNYLQLPFGFPAPGVQGISIEKSFSSRTLAGDQPWEGLKGDGANPHPSYLTDMRTTPGTNNGRTWLALHRLPSTDPHSVNNDSPSKSLPALSHPSSTTEADQTRIPSPHEGGLVFAVDDRVDSLLNDGAALATEEPSRNESPTEGQPRNPTQLVQDPSSAGLDLRTEPEGTEYSFHKLEDGLYKCTWKYESQRPCGFTSRKNSVKQHIKRVHLRLRCRII